MIEKEAQVWHMDTLRHKENYFQCIHCGDIHKEYSDEVIDLENQIHYVTVCPKCRQMRKHLDVGESESEIGYYADWTLDKRYY